MLVLDIGGTAIKYAVADGEGRLLPGTAAQRPAHADGSYEAFLNVLRDIIAEARRSGELTRASVSIPGPFDYANGISRMKHKFQALYGKSLKTPFNEAGLPVRFLHDSTAFLLGEAGENDPPDCCGIMLGTGLGFAWMRDRRVLVDENQTPALTLWNMPFREGITEDYVSTRALLGRVPGTPDVKTLAEAARSGNPAAKEAFRAAGEALSELMNLLLPELGAQAVLFGGQIARSLDLFALELPVPWRVCEHPEEAALRGAARYAVLGPEGCVRTVPPFVPSFVPSTAAGKKG